MSQPHDRGAALAPPGKLDPELGEFWVSNPWLLVNHGHNLSSFERNRAYLNVKGTDFLEISHLTSADSDGDGRSVVAADFRNSGQLDLLVRQAGGGPLLFFHNQMPRGNFLSVTLQGRQSNRQGIGARVTAVAGGLRQAREMYPASGFISQAPSRLHFGLGDAKVIDSLRVQWPTGKTQTFSRVNANRHIVIDEAVDGPEAIKDRIEVKVAAGSP